MPGEDCVQLRKDKYTWCDASCSMEFLPMCNDVDLPISTYPDKDDEDENKDKDDEDKEYDSNDSDEYYPYMW